MTAPYTVVKFGGRYWQVQDGRGHLCGWYRMTNEQAEMKAERLNSQSKETTMNKTIDPAEVAAIQCAALPKPIGYNAEEWERYRAELYTAIRAAYIEREAKVAIQFRQATIANRERDAAAAELARVIDEMPTGNEIVGAHDSQEINNPDYWSMEQYIDFEIDKVRDATARFRATCALSAPNPEPAEPPASPGAAMENTLAD